MQVVSSKGFSIAGKGIGLVFTSNTLQIFSQAKRWVVVQAKLGTRGFCFGQHSKEKEAKRKIALDLKVSLVYRSQGNLVRS